ncbi:hypothetical protein [Cellulomonas biazotea]|uniref:AbiEi antitoxin C-terminal domain-containing protein n=1 Tax=Cellulomonas biazotea TaxID=1709 RepID=A0A402DM12_9CELL|nr:hypothetical protein [Cellulomonas biazotea]GCE75165.1 hypothetical protein CBZ_02210 [Cellulomonas biazotea]
MTSVLDAYLPRRPAVPLIVRRRDVGTAAWFALLRDGVLRPLWTDVAVAADLDVSPALRSAALADDVPPEAVVGRRSAAWVHAGGPPPDKVDVLVRPGRRAVSTDRRSAAEQALVADDVEFVGPLRVTTVCRTGTDVARFVPGADASRILVELLGAGFDPHAALRRLDRLPGGRGVRRARAVLEGLDPAIARDPAIERDPATVRDPATSRDPATRSASLTRG